jgi:hypothetical protein
VTTRPAPRLFAFAAAAAALLLAGLAAALLPRAAGADPLPTVTVPGVTTVTPPPLPPLPVVSSTTAATTTTASTTAPATGQQTQQTPQPAGGAVAPPTTTPTPTSTQADRLVIDRVWIVPRAIRARAPFLARVRVRDGRGTLVRGAVVSIGSAPVGRIRRVPARMTGASGTVRFTVRPTRVSQRERRLVIVVSARLADMSAQRKVAVRVKR